MNRMLNVLIGEYEGIIAADLKSLFNSWGWSKPYVTKDLKDVEQKSLFSKFELVIIDENIIKNESVFALITQLVISGKSRVIFLADSFNHTIPENLNNCASFYCLSKPFNYSELANAVHSGQYRSAAM